MHILLVADGRSPIARNWVKGLNVLGHHVSLISSFVCEKPVGIEQFHILPVAFAGLAGSQVRPVRAATGATTGSLRQSVARFRSIYLSLRYRLGPLTLPYYGSRLRKLVSQMKPDLVHALRIPYEGLLAAYTPRNIPLAVSIWGNDLTLHGYGSAAMRRLTLKVMQRANGLAADARRDLRLAALWGFDMTKPTLLAPGGGGVDLSEINRVRTLNMPLSGEPVPEGFQLVINPRGFRPGSVRNDVFFQAIPMVLQRNPKVVFVALAMAGQPEALQWVEHIRLLPFLPQEQVWNLFQKSAVTVSVSSHDGTPNSLLEAMACGCFPVVGDIESLREWITPGINGLLVEPHQPQAVAEAILLALENPDLRRVAVEANQALVHQRAETGLVRAQSEVFYQRITSSTVSEV
jgi:glycosyltransferase involved in cell wall biosynthesis